MLELLLIIPGILLLMKGADYFVEAASSLALKLKVKPIFIGLTVVAFGTSFPELVVNLLAATSGNTQIALGNVVGSNIANFLLILGAAAVLTKIKVGSNTVWKEIPFSLLGVVVILFLAVQTLLDQRIFSINSEFSGNLTFTHGLVLLLFFVIFIFYTFGIAKNNETIEEDFKEEKTFKSTLKLIIGLSAVILGGKFTVDSAVSIANLFGISQTLIGLTVVAIGTSLPELITSIVAARKNEADLAIGNAVGSNIFNIFLILGITATVKDIPVNYNNIIDIFILLFVTLYVFLNLFIFEKHRLGRKEGIGMLIFYFSYIIYLVVRG
jgi:cation:H+ antiporter